MDNLNNLFWFSTKELTQDAVLMWILKNYKDPNLKDVARSIIGHFCFDRELREDEVIKELRGKQQYKGVDLAIEFFLDSNTDGGWYYLIIEDKTYSYLHSNQIKKYLEISFKDFDSAWHVKNRPNTNIKVIYFKMTSFNKHDEDELFKETKEASEENYYGKNSIFDCAKDVRRIDLTYFYEKIISKFANSKNYVLNEYVIYVRDRYEAMLAGKGKIGDITKFFIGYPDVWKDEQDERIIECSFVFFSSLFEEMSKRIKNSEFWWAQYEYFWFKYYRDKSENQNLPIIEIRSRDFLYDGKKTIIEVHLANYTAWFGKFYEEHKEEYIKLTRKWANYLESKYSSILLLDTFKYKPSAKNGNQRQLGTLIYEKDGPMTYDELIDILNKLIKVQEIIDDELERLK